MYLWRTPDPQFKFVYKVHSFCFHRHAVDCLLWMLLNFQHIKFLYLKDFSDYIFPKTFYAHEILQIESWSGGLNSLFGSWTISVSSFIRLISCGSLFGLWILETFCTFKIWQSIFYWGCLYHVICFWSSFTRLQDPLYSHFISSDPKIILHMFVKWILNRWLAGVDEGDCLPWYTWTQLGR